MNFPEQEQIFGYNTYELVGDLGGVRLLAM